MDDDDCDGCEECTTTEFVVLPSIRWRWLDLGIATLDFLSETAVALSRALAYVNDAMRAHYNWQVDQRAVAEMASSEVFSLTEE